MFYLFLADGFEETEALAPLDMMRRAKIEVKTVGVTGEVVTGSHGVPVKADLKPVSWLPPSPVFTLLTNDTIVSE